MRILIRDEQLQALKRARRPNLKDRLLELLRRRPLPIAGAELRRCVREAIDRAYDVHGLSTEAGVADYVALAVELLPGFDEDRAVKACLSGPGTPEERLARVYEELDTRDWKRLRRSA